MKKEKKRSTRARKRAFQHKVSILMVSGVVIILGIMLSVASISLHTKHNDLEARRTELEKELDAENARAEEIDELEDYVGTDEYIEDVAKDKLGLVYPNEILFEAAP